MGLKMRMAAYWLLVSAALSAGLFVVADRLARHRLLSQLAELSRPALGLVAAGLADCEEPLPQCPKWQSATRQLGRLLPQLKTLSLLDGAGRLLDSTDSALRSEALWEFFSAGPPSAGETVRPCGSGRCLWMAVSLPEREEKLVASFDLESVLAKGRALGRTLLLYSVLLSLAAALAGWLLSGRLAVWPLDKLMRQAENIQLADLELPQVANEFGSLGVALRRMSRRIQDDRVRLERQIAELERLNRDLQVAQVGLLRSEKLASVGRLAAGVAHEVGNPMSAILGYLGLLKSDDVPADEKRDMIERVENEIERIDQVIRSLLSYSRQEKPKSGPLPPRQAADHALELIRPQKTFKTISCQLEVAEGLPDCQADPALVRQVLVNVMLNALDASSTGGHLWLRAAAARRTEDGRLCWQTGSQPLEPGAEPEWFALGELHRIRLPRDGKWLETAGAGVVFSVTDDGSGIPEEDQLKVFDPFFTTKEPGQGTGLGLAICHSAVEAMGGEIWLWSRPGTGTQVSFILPLAT